MIHHKIELPAANDAVASALDALEERLGQEGIEMAQSLELRLVGEEVLTNIVKYAETGAPVEVEIQASTDEIVLEFRDRGRAFDPLAAEEPDLEASVEERALGGLGIYLVRELMDDVAYRREEGTNILRVVKRL